MTIRSINRLGLTICTVAPMLAISSCSTVSNGASVLLAAPVILPIAGIYALSQAEVRAEERRRERSIKAKRTDGPFTELWPNGKKRVEGTYKNKELSGPYKVWYENGQICEEGSYIDGKEHGQWKDYWADGTKRETGTYKFGKRDGLWTFYWTDSAGRNYKGIEVTWKDGTKHGLTTKWHENGQKSREYNYINGAHDYWKSFDENGKIKNEGSYSGW
ncbi:MAG: hypothetical protein P8Q54_05005 [Akkermansiaceae bacterium]|nr:hypothetical protein [Akkermansiaceae bacterium]